MKNNKQHINNIQNKKKEVTKQQNKQEHNQTNKQQRIKLKPKNIK